MGIYTVYEGSHSNIYSSHGLLDTHAKCTNKGLLGNGVSRGLRTRVSLSSKKDPIYGVSSEKGRLLFRECCAQYSMIFFPKENWKSVQS